MYRKIKSKFYHSAGTLHPISMGREPKSQLDLSRVESEPGLQSDILGYWPLYHQRLFCMVGNCTEKCISEVLIQQRRKTPLNIAGLGMIRYFDLSGGESSNGLQCDRLGYWPLYYQRIFWMVATCTKKKKPEVSLPQRRITPPKLFGSRKKKKLYLSGGESHPGLQCDRLENWPLFYQRFFCMVGNCTEKSNSAVLLQQRRKTPLIIAGSRMKKILWPLWRGIEPRCPVWQTGLLSTVLPETPFDCWRMSPKR